MNKIFVFIKKEPVLIISLLLAFLTSVGGVNIRLLSEYIDFRTISLLFCLMTVMAGLQGQGVFAFLAHKLLKRVQTRRMLVLILVMLCFFFSMFITNDVALITFVPFTIVVLNMTGGKSKMLIPVVVMQTVAANLGSMLTPIGNPQNLYLYTKSGMDIGEFIKLMLPYSAISFAVIIIYCFVFTRKNNDRININTSAEIEDKNFVIMYIILFILCILTVGRVLPYPLTLAVVAITTAMADKKTLLSVDYSLLLTFFALFVFIGNISNLSFDFNWNGTNEHFELSDFFGSITKGHEIIASVAASQIISNVPAAILLSGFTENHDKLIIGTNIGGLGTLIASMASLISFKFVIREDNGCGKQYIKYFSIINVLFLIILLACI